MTLYEIYFREFTGVSTEEFNKIVEKEMHNGKSGKEMLFEYMQKNNISEEQLKDAASKVTFLKAIKEMENK